MSLDANDTTHLIPLVVAVTGHRDIDPLHEDIILKRITSKFRELHSQYPHTPIRCLSGLAEGADTLFAKAALDLGYELVAVLPGSSEHFAKDFDAPAHPHRNSKELRQTFQELLGRCVEVITVCVPEHLTGRPEQYALVGAYLARHSHILFSLWDGKESSKVGGTRFVLKQFQQVDATLYQDTPSTLLDTPETRPVYNLYVPRKDTDHHDRLFTWADLDNNHIRETKPKLQALDRFNTESEKLKQNKPELLQQSAAYLGVTPQTFTLERGETHIRGAFLAADALAGEFQKRSRRDLRVIFLTATFMLFSFSWYSNIAASPKTLGAYILFFITGLVIYLCNKTSKCYTKYLDYRGLAEGLRVLLFFRLSAAPIKASDQYLRKYRSEITWIRDAIRTIDLTMRRNTPEIALVSTHWIDDQMEYFAKAYKINSTQKTINDCIAILLFSTGLILAIVWYFLQDQHTAVGANPDVMKWVVTGIGLLPALAAIVSGYTFRLGLDQHSKQYSRMFEVFQRAAKALESLPAEEQAPSGQQTLTEREKRFIALAMELGKESLAENSDWILLHRDRPMTWPQ